MTLELTVAGRKVAALMDARPSVVDFGTIKSLGLEKDIVEEPNEVYGLCKAPVKVKGHIEISIQVGRGEPRKTKLQVLESSEPIMLLGRAFMKDFGSVSFDWERGRSGLARSGST